MDPSEHAGVTGVNTTDTIPVLVDAEVLGE